MVHYLFPSVESNLKLERRCPHCHRLGGNKHSRIRYRAVSDIKLHAIAQQRRSSIQVVELEFKDGWLVCDRDRPTHILLQPPVKALTN